jgi:hypothetical protein
MKLLLIFILISDVSCKPFVRKACDYPVTEFRLSQNKKGDWAILNSAGEVLSYSTRYMSYGFYPYDANEAMTFSDSCSAKGLLKMYLENQDKNSFK